LKKWVVREAATFTASPIWLHFSGESLLHPRLEEVASVLRDRGAELMLSTNASLLDSARIDMLLRMDLALIVFSIDAFHEETYNQIRHGGDFQSIQRNIFSFLERKPAGGRPLTQAQLVLGTQTLEEVLEFIWFWAQTNVDSVHIKRYSTRGGKLFMPEGARPSHPTEHGNCHKACFDPWSNVIIRVDGTVVPCCTDFNGELTLGNINENTLEEIWNGEPAQSLRRAHLTGVNLPEICRQCSDRRFPGESGKLHDSIVTTDIPETADKLREVLASAPRHLIFDFRSKKREESLKGHGDVA
jgi:radical SAM protein with 4Fe4S-binding SPASM domain